MTVTIYALGMLASCHPSYAQGVLIDLTPLEGVELRPDNALNFSIANSGGAINALVKGTLKFKGSPLQASYAFTTSLPAGTTVFSRERAGYPGWQFSNPALRDLFLTYGKLPQGTYEYCVTITFPGAGGEGGGNPADACTYHTVDDIFLINLVDPEDNAKLYEHNPVLSWVVNYPFAAELTYRVRVAELKSGQNAVNAIARNNPVYQEHNVFATAMTYPVTARPLQTWQPYAWTVDAYYKGLLLGGAEPWRFTIVEDSALSGIPRETYHVDIRRERNATGIYAIGKAKIKYELVESRTDSLMLTLQTESGRTLKLSPGTVRVQEGDNRLDIDLTQTTGVRHLSRYTLHIRDGRGNAYALPFRYVNPDYLP